ncbi:MAG: C40 family peptidase [Clostridia bacterium]|nr:C40 family peptidase [Clostridia bacterium]
MNYIKYLSDRSYKNRANDCWTFVQTVFKDEHNVVLPDYPIMTDKQEIATALISNIPYKLVNKAEKGCIVYYHNGKNHHAAYALNDKKMIHKTLGGVQVTNIPKNSTIFKVLND